MEAQKKGINIYILGIGDASGARIPDGNGGYMTTTSGSSSSRGIQYTTGSTMTIPPMVQGFITSASSVSNGQTASETYAHISERRSFTPSTRRSALPEGVCEECHWVQDENGDWYCDRCGAYAIDGCEAHEHGGHCGCPLDMDYKAIIFLIMMAMTFVIKKTKRQTI